MPTHWNREHIPSLDGKSVIVTGANSGIGFEAALALAAKGAQLTLACRDPAKGQRALELIRADAASAQVDLQILDLASLASVGDFAKRYADSHDRLDLLVNHAGIMALPYAKTADGFEMQFGTNHLGHFALTGQLFGLLSDTPNSRVVSVSSIAHRFGWMKFDDLQSEQRYTKWTAYGQSKLANLLFTYELARRAETRELSLTATAAHPGYSNTNLQHRSADASRLKLDGIVMRIGNKTVAQSAAMGALPTLRAAVGVGARNGDYYGPGGWLEQRGYPVIVQSNARSQDPQSAGQLWDISMDLTGVRFLD